MFISVHSWPKRFFTILLAAAPIFAQSPTGWPTYNRDLAWKVPSGLTETLPPGTQNTGRAGASAGPIATGGGLVFIGATGNNRFRAFDSKTRKELWTQKLEYSATAVPITCRGKSGKQYVAIVAAGGGRGNNQALLALALP